MSRWYVNQDHTLVDYGDGFWVGEHWFRGENPTRRPYLAAIGAAQTFGRLRNEPFVDIVADSLGISGLNLGRGGASFRLFSDSVLLDLINGADLVIIQIISARMCANAKFTPVGTNRFGYTPEGELVTADEFWDRTISQSDHSQLQSLVAESQKSYLQEAQALIKKIRPPKLLLWFGSDRSPIAANAGYSHPTLIKSFPHLVAAEQCDGLRPLGDFFVDAHGREGLPEIVAPGTAGSMLFGGLRRVNGFVTNDYYPSEAMHRQAARSIIRTLSGK